MNEEVYGVDFGEYMKRVTPEIREMMNAEGDYLKGAIAKGDTVLECGSGSGRIVKLVAGLASRVIGVDFSPAQVESSKKNVPQGNAGIVPWDIMELPFKERVFDAATLMFSTLGGFDDIEKIRVLREIRRVLKKGGRLILSAYAENAYSYQKAWYEQLGFETHSKDGTTYAYGKMGSLRSETFTKKRLERVLAMGGFENVAIKRLNNFSYIAELMK